MSLPGTVRAAVGETVYREPTVKMSDRINFRFMFDLIVLFALLGSGSVALGHTITLTGTIRDFQGFDPTAGTGHP